LGYFPIKRPTREMHSAFRFTKPAHRLLCLSAKSGMRGSQTPYPTVQE